MKWIWITPAAVLLTLSIAASSSAQTESAAAKAERASKLASEGSGASEGMEAVNADLVAARAATKDKRYADAEAIMLKTTAARPNLIVPYLELGLAQLGLKKYAEAESSFQIALGIDIKSQDLKHSDEYYDRKVVGQVKITRNTLGGFAVNEQARTPEIKGVGYTSLGEIYVRTNRISEAKEAFNSAVKANPADAALYRRNETTFFYQVQNAPAEVEAANQAIALDPSRAILYYFKAQGLVGQATVDEKTQKLTLPPGCADAYLKYLELEPGGPFAPEVKGVLSAAGIAPGSGNKAGRK